MTIQEYTEYCEKKWKSFFRAVETSDSVWIQCTDPDPKLLYFIGSYQAGRWHINRGEEYAIVSVPIASTLPWDQSLYIRPEEE
jgi:hypothetical protein